MNDVFSILARAICTYVTAESLGRALANREAWLRLHGCK